MREARRDYFLSAAQVAFHYGGYTLETATSLSHDERDILLAVARDEQTSEWDKLGRVLGTTWDIRTLVHALDATDQEGGTAKPKPLQSKVNLPLLMAVAPEFFSSLVKEYKSKYEGMLAVQHEGGGGPVVELSTLSTEAARAFYKNIGSMVAANKPPDDGDVNG